MQLFTLAFSQTSKCFLHGSFSRVAARPLLEIIVKPHGSVPRLPTQLLNKNVYVRSAPHVLPVLGAEFGNFQSSLNHYEIISV